MVQGRERTVIRIVCAFLAATISTGAHAQSAENPLVRLLKSDTDSLCFRRDYDAAHLKRHPGQATQTALLSFRNDAVRIMLRQSGKDSYIVASCSFSARAGYDTSGKPMIKAFKGPGGYDCIVMVSPESAQEGGYVLLDPAGGDGGTLTLYADSPVSARRKLDMNARVFDLKLGTQDREFRLTRADNAACEAMNAVLKGP
jgi:hypothetical protein